MQISTTVVGLLSTHSCHFQEDTEASSNGDAAVASAAERRKSGSATDRLGDSIRIEVREAVKSALAISECPFPPPSPFGLAPVALIQTGGER